MSVEGLILHHGEAHGVTLHQTRLDYLVTAEHSKQCSLFESRLHRGSTRARTTTPRSRRFSTFSRESSICGAVNAPYVAGREHVYSVLPARRTHSETRVRRRAGCC